MSDNVRIDSFLWSVRIFKSRSIASEACKKHRVAVNGVEAKPSRTIKVGDTLTLRKSPITYTFKVLKLAKSRMGAKLVPEHIENCTPQSEYELLELKRISGFVDRAKGTGRPTKRERRMLDDFRDQARSIDFFLADEDFFDLDDNTEEPPLPN